MVIALKSPINSLDNKMASERIGVSTLVVWRRINFFLWEGNCHLVVGLSGDCLSFSIENTRTRGNVKN